MSFLKTEGIVVKEVGTGEADKIITILTRGQGRISALVKGGRRPRSRLSAGSRYSATVISFSSKAGIYTA